MPDGQNKGRHDFRIIQSCAEGRAGAKNRTRSYGLALAVSILAASACLYYVYDVDPLPAEWVLVANPESYPLVGDTWTVHLEVGGGTLRVDAADGTEFGRDVEFSGMYRDNGSTIKPAGLDPLVFEDLAAGSWRFEVGVLTDGPHHLRFSLGGNAAYASNTASITDVTSDTPDGTYVSGNITDIRMTFTEPFVLDQFAIRGGDHDATRSAFTELEGARGITTVLIDSSTYALVASNDDDGVQIINITDPKNPTATADITDGTGGFTELEGTRDITTVLIDSSTYALVAAYDDRGVQIINISDPKNPVPTAAVKDGQDGFNRLRGVTGITTATIGDYTYALVASSYEDAVQIINITDPENPTATAAVKDGQKFTELDGAAGITTATIGDYTYALVAAYADSGVQIIDITDPENPTATAAVTDGSNFPKLGGATGITTATIGDYTYALVAAYIDSGVQIIDITDPENPTAAAAVSNGSNFPELEGARGITTATIGDYTYALVASAIDDGVQIIDITNASSPTAAAAVSNGSNFPELDGAWGITTATVDGTPYALVASNDDDGVQIINISDPVLPTPTADVKDGQNAFTLDHPVAVTTALIGSSTYALVTAYDDDAVQIINITDPESPTITAAVTDGQNGFTELDGVNDITTATIGDYTYALATAISDDGVQIINITDPENPTATAAVTDGQEGFTVINEPRGITTTTIGEDTYALVANRESNNVQIIDISDPALPTQAADIINGTGGFTALGGATGITTATINGTHYALVASIYDDAVQIINITTPSAPEPVTFVTDEIGGFTELEEARGITTATIGDYTYALVTGFSDHGVQIIDITDPKNPTATANVRDSEKGFTMLKGPRGIATVTIGDYTYAVVLSYTGPGVQIINITNPENPTATAAVTDGPIFTELDTPRGIATATIGDYTYALVTGALDDGVQIIDITNPANPFNPLAPYISLDAAPGDPGRATFTGTADDSHTLVFEYLVRANDSTPDLAYTGTDAFSMGHGILRDADDGTDLSQLSLPEPGTPRSLSHNKNIVLGTNIPLTVEAGPDQTVGEGDTVTLSGTATDDDLGDTLTYEWTHDGPSGITFANPAALSTSFTAPDVAANTTFTVTLTVNDGTVEVFDTLQVTITDSPNSPPEVEAGADQTVGEGDTVTLSGTATDDDLGDTLTYEWTHDGPSGITFANPAALSTSFTAPDVAANTTFTVTLTVNDGTVEVFDTLQVTITDSPNSPPEVEAGADQTVGEGATVSLSGTATDDDLGDTLTYEWTHDGPSGITFANPAALSTSFTAPDVAANTTFTVTLTVNDGTVEVFDTLQVTITDSPNSPPEVEAGADQTVGEGATVSLSGTVSDDDPGDTLTYEWTHDGPSGITFANPAALSTSFTAPDVAANTTFTVTLTVNDGTVEVFDTLQVTIADSPNSPPEVEAGADQEVAEGATVSLSGTATDDDPGDTLTYEWTHDGPSGITFANPAALSTSFTAPDVAANTTVTVTLTVNDGTVDVTDTLQVTITDSPNSPPTVNAGQDQEVVEGATVALSGTATDDDGDTLTYSWTHDGTPAITFADPTALSTSFTAPNVAFNTTVTVTLTVNDGTVDVTDTLQVTITDSPNSPPTVNAGQDQEVVEGATVALSGTVSDDDPEDAPTYSWTHDGTLSITITGSDSASASFTAPDVAANTTITVTLTVNDGTAEVSDTLQVTITDSPNSPPTVNAGQDQEVVEGATVALSGTATDDDGDTLAYSWTHDDTLAITITGSDSASASFTAPDVASNTTITVTLTVDDGTAEVSDTLQVTIADSPNSPLTVNAGQDQEVDEGATVSLGATVTDPDSEDTLTYSWSHDSSLEVTLTDGNTTRPQFTAPGVTSDESIVFTFAATDGSESAEDTVTITVRDVPIAVSSAAYGSGTITITFNQDIDGAPDYSGIHVRDTGSDTGGIALSNVGAKLHSGRTITATLGAAQQDEYDELQSPQLDVDLNAVTDAEGIGIQEMHDITIRTAGSDKKSSTPPPAIGLDALASLGVDIPPYIAEMASERGSGPVPPVAPDGTFDFPLVINGQGYLLAGSLNTLVPHVVAAGQPVTISVSIHDQTPIAYFAIYLNLQGNEISHLQSDAQIIWDSGEVRIIDPDGLMQDVAIILSEDPDDPARKTATITVTLSDGIGETNMVIRTWNTAGQITEVKIFDALDVRVQEPEPVAIDPEPDEKPNSADLEPVTVPGTAPGMTDSDPDADGSLLTIRMWSGFEPESIADAQLLASLNLDYPGADIPSWVMTELGPLAAKGDITIDEFKTALEYVLNNS